ncbi:S-layer homology domain-containing protein [Agathobaculum sp. Marseille-P7918]|uniref:S-layer homology domain-containing protein n=1 Tax=Agathobaculum sp. Marseille-P7918 TaxID=2479843 RepID=UPI000F64422E|nr:S-layer homology domain-containing protein [Agathobaculum sp. Marseille-P7918]
MDNGIYAFNDITSGHTIPVVYAEDKIGEKDPEQSDNIPDKYQATVIYTAGANGKIAESAKAKEVLTIEDNWYNTAVSTMAALGIIKGRTETTFEPDAPITRAEFAAICARFDTGRTDGDSNFTDLSGHWAKDEIERAATLGWITGYPDGTFRPENAITRAEAMTMINRVLQRLPEDESDLLSNMQTWPDNLSSAWYYLAVQEATNSHDFDRKDDGVHEKWTALTANPDWTAFQ